MLDPLRRAILACFYKHDPMDLAPADMPQRAPADEYLPETEAVAWTLQTRPPANVTDLRALIHDIVGLYFAPANAGPDVRADVGPLERYDALAQEVWAIWKEQSAASERPRG